MTATVHRVPPDLVDAVRQGRCVAFVGAGFSLPSKPTWSVTLERLAKQLEPSARRTEIESWLASTKTSRDLEGIAAAIHSELGERFLPGLREAMGGELQPANLARRDLLLRIPFHSILTTNFDELLPGTSRPGPEQYAELLTQPQRPWWDGRSWDSSVGCQPPILKIHGCLQQDGGVVFTTQDYRRLVHETPSYRAFLRALFATHTILYLGFSFTDAYINETRSEILSMLGLNQSHRRGSDFAVLADVSPVVAAHLRDYEGLIPLSYATTGNDHSGFDAWLRAIHDATSPEATLRAVTQGRRILWVDPNVQNNAYGYEVLTGASPYQRHPLIDQVESVERALERLEVNRGPRDGGPSSRYDLVISHYGHHADGPSNLERLAVAMRSQDVRVPLIVFASGAQREHNRRQALELGALAYTDTWPELLQTLERLFVDGDRRAPAR